MNFVEIIFEQCRKRASSPVLQEVIKGEAVPATGRELLEAIASARQFLRRAGLRRGDRCALLAPNGIRWTAVDLAIIAEGAIVVPLYSRQAPAELIAMMKDSTPALLCCGDAGLRDAIASQWSGAPRTVLFDEIFQPAAIPVEGDTLPPLADDDPVTIIYTSGTSGEAKGVVLSCGNVGFMLRRTSGKLDSLMGSTHRPDNVFHYLPCCFAGSWILLLTCLTRNSVLTLSTDLTKLVEEMKVASPDYFLNVPALLERIRAGIETQFEKWGGFKKALYDSGKIAWAKRRAGTWSAFDYICLALAERLVFSAIKKKIGANVKALICGSAPLSLDTQLFFIMLGIPVLQVYGLTETTAICTMDEPGDVEPGLVGPAIDGIEMKLGPNEEVLVRGPNVFKGYWDRPEATSEALREGWFHTGDQGEVNEAGKWRITGRIKNLIVLGSGHNVAPEPIEESLLRNIPFAHQVVIVGNGRGFLSAIVTGDIERKSVETAIESINPGLPHYRRIRAFHIHKEPFSVENGLLTANGKLKRDRIAEILKNEIEEMYRDQKA